MGTRLLNNSDTSFERWDGSANAYPKKRRTYVPSSSRKLKDKRKLQEHCNLPAHLTALPFRPNISRKDRIHSRFDDNKLSQSRKARLATMKKKKKSNKYYELFYYALKEKKINKAPNSYKFTKNYN